MLDRMLGRPEWFIRRRVGWGLTPVTWQGWVYCIFWLTAIALPFNLLLTFDQPGPAVVWMALMVTVLVTDAKKILAAMPPEPALPAAAPSTAAPSTAAPSTAAEAAPPEARK